MNGNVTIKLPSWMKRLGRSKKEASPRVTTTAIELKYLLRTIRRQGAEMLPDIKNFRLAYLLDS
jgi:hypothetical protein